MVPVCVCWRGGVDCYFSFHFICGALYDSCRYAQAHQGEDCSPNLAAQAATWAHHNTAPPHPTNNEQSSGKYAHAWEIQMSATANNRWGVWADGQNSFPCQVERANLSLRVGSWKQTKINNNKKNQQINSGAFSPQHLTVWATPLVLARIPAPLSSTDYLSSQAAHPCLPPFSLSWKAPWCAPFNVVWDANQVGSARERMMRPYQNWGDGNPEIACLVPRRLLINSKGLEIPSRCCTERRGIRFCTVAQIWQLGK